MKRWRWAQKIRNGDKAALDRLVSANLRFVVSVAKKYQHQGMSLGDLINEGNLGLIKAAHRFDETRGFKFISFAVWWIRQSIMAAIKDDTRMIRLPGNHIAMMSRINKSTATLEQQLERPASDEELAEISELTAEKITDAKYFSGRTVSYDAPISPEDDYALIDRLWTPEPEDRQAEVGHLLARLSPMECEIVRFCYGLGSVGVLSLPEIGKRVGMSSENVRLIRNKAIKKLRGCQF